MNSYKFTKEKAREFLKQEVINEINDNADFTKFQSRVYCVVAKYGLQLEAKEEGLLTGDEWNDPDCKDFLIQKIKGFLDKHIV